MLPPSLMALLSFMEFFDFHLHQSHRRFGLELCSWFQNVKVNLVPNIEENLVPNLKENPSE